MADTDKPIGCRRSCLVCGGSEVTEVLRTPPVPILCNQLLYDARQAANLARAAIVLAGCHRCGHLFNRAFDAHAVHYHQAYENSLMGSPRYREYTSEIIERLFAVRNLTGGTVVEIGCGRGEFMRMLCERGMSRAVGFDPGRPDEVAAVGNATMMILGKPFDQTAAPPQAELVCARHVIEHLPDPVSFLASLNSEYLSNHGLLLVEVPNGCYTLEALGFWDLIYEHVSYFSPGSLSWALMAAGLVTDRVSTTFGGQFLLAEAAVARSGRRAALPDTANDPSSHFTSFAAAFHSTVSAWKRWLHAARNSGRRIALWGAGSKGITFLNLTDRHHERAVKYVVDVNPRKAGAFVAGTGHAIASPAALQGSPPDTILLMNPEYEAEVRRMLRSLEVRAELLPVSGSRPPDN